MPLSGAYAVVTAGGGNYILTVYNSTGKALTSATQTITPSSSQAYNYNTSPNAPQVAGATVAIPQVLLRGPEPAAAATNTYRPIVFR